VESKIAVGKWFDVKTVINATKQCPTAFTLFPLMKQATTQIELDGHSDTFVYTDDVRLVTYTQEELQETLNICCGTHRPTDSGLKLNTAKSEVTVVSRMPDAHFDMQKDTN